MEAFTLSVLERDLWDYINASDYCVDKVVCNGWFGASSIVSDLICWEIICLFLTGMEFERLGVYFHFDGSVVVYFLEIRV